MSENLQEELFHEDIYHALRSLIDRAGGPKRVASILWPNKPLDQATRWLADCLNTDRAAKLDPEDVIALLRIGRESDAHMAMAFIASKAGYDCRPITPEEAQETVAIRMEKAVREMRAMLREWERAR